MKKCARKSVVVVTSLGMLTGQQQLAGILDANLSKTRWLLSVIDREDFTASRLRQALEKGADGFIVHLPGTPEAMKLLLETDVPAVLVNIGGYRTPKGRRRLSYVWTDNEEIGRIGAEHFMRKNGYRAFAFVSSESCEATPDGFWSRERRQGFRDRLQQEQITCETHSTEAGIDDWLRAVPKPVAVMASHDAIALQLVADCRRLGLAVPNEVSILGVDDTETGDQGISSVNIDFRKAGQMEVQELDELMRTPNRKSANELMISCSGVVGRKSTALAARSNISSRALRFIGENAYSGISVNDVVAFLGCSRRLAEIKFRKDTKRTIRSEIERIRLGHARKLLKTKTATLRDVARKCGYSCADVLARALARAKQREQAGLASTS